MVIRRRDYPRGLSVQAVPAVDSGTWLSHLIAPLEPTRPSVTSEHLKIRSGAAAFHDLVELVGLSGVFALPRNDDVRLPATVSQCAVVLPPDTEQTYLGHIPEVEA